MPAIDEDVSDPRNQHAREYDALTDQVREQVKAVSDLRDIVSEYIRHHSSGTTQTVVHKTEGMGAWGAAAVTACFATMIGLILVAMEIHDLKAWSDVYRGQISKLLEAKK